MERVSYIIEFTSAKHGYTRYGRVTRKGRGLTKHLARATAWRKKETAEKHKLYFSTLFTGGSLEVVEVGGLE